MIDSLSALTGLMRSHGASRIFAKKLAPNDNSKNQIYLGGDMSSLHIIPHGNIETDARSTAGSKRDRAKASLRLYWITPEGRYLAPYAQLILYPKYPEVRLSGFLKGCQESPASILTTREQGRGLFIGVTPAGDILAYVAEGGSHLALELSLSEGLAENGVFLEIPLSGKKNGSRSQLLEALKNIYLKSWIQSQKIDSSGSIKPYKARNGGGYTLEAELGISPNGISEPDYHGWEIKQYSVRDFESYKAKGSITLMTPEPNGGIYKSEGVKSFMSRLHTVTLPNPTSQIPLRAPNSALREDRFRTLPQSPCSWHRLLRPGNKNGE